MSEPIVIRILQGMITTDSRTFNVMAESVHHIMQENRPVTTAEAIMAAVVMAFLEWKPQEVVGEIGGEPFNLQFHPYPEKEQTSEHTLSTSPSDNP